MSPKTSLLLKKEWKITGKTQKTFPLKPFPPFITFKVEVSRLTAKTFRRSADTFIVNKVSIF